MKIYYLNLLGEKNSQAYKDIYGTKEKAPESKPEETTEKNQKKNPLQKNQR